MKERADVLRAVGCEEQKLCERVNFNLRVKQNGAKSLAESGSARLARGDDLKAAHPQLTCEQAQLRGFTASVYAFKGDKSAAHLIVVSSEVELRFDESVRSRKILAR
jgi:hypothetical protein